MKKEHIKLKIAVHLLLIRNGKILLLRRFNTGYEDGKYSVPAGHLDGSERSTEAMVRESLEEIGTVIREDRLQMVHVMHRMSEEERVDFFFEVTLENEEPKNCEPHKCDDLSWFNIDVLPDNVIPYVRVGIRCYLDHIPFSEFGW